MTGKAEQGRAAAFEQAVERAVAAALDRHLSRLADHLADAVADRVLDRLDRHRQVERLIRKRVGQVAYPAPDAAAWIEAHYDQKGCSVSVRAQLCKWRQGKPATAKRQTIEKMIRALGGDPHELPDELPPAVPDAAENGGRRE